MWMVLTDGLFGNLDRNVFLMLRAADGAVGEVELVHVDLDRPPELQQRRLLLGDQRACFEAFELLADDLEVSDALVRLLEDGLVDEGYEFAGSTLWVELDDSTIMNLDTGALISLIAEEGGDAVACVTTQGSLVLFSGERDETDAYLNALAAALGASDAILEAGAGARSMGGAGGAFLSGMKKGQA